MFDFLGLLAFRKVKTTINPITPDLISALAKTGIYRVTPNPMYVGLELSGRAIYQESPASLLGVVGFITYIHWLQILPEERMLIIKVWRGIQGLPVQGRTFAAS